MMLWLGIFWLACFALFLEMADRAPLVDGVWWSA